MSLVSAALDRMFREWLEPADEQPTRFSLAAAITTTSATSFTVDPTFLSPEEEDLFGPGTLVEIEQEWIQVGDYDPDTNIASDCKRGVGGTTAATHLISTEGKIAPKYGRKAAFDAFCDELVGLWPDLYAIDETDSMTFSTTTYTEVAATVMYPMYAWARPTGSSSNSQWGKYPVEFLDHFPASSTGKAVLGRINGSGYLVHKVKFARPANEAVNLTTTTLLNEEWERIVEVGAVAQLVGAQDLSAAEASYLSEQLAASNFPVGSGGSVRDGLLRYHRYLLDRAKRSMRAREDTVVVTNNPWG